MIRVEDTWFFFFFKSEEEPSNHFLICCAHQHQTERVHAISYLELHLLNLYILTRLLFFLNKQKKKLLLSRQHPRSLGNHPLLSLLTLLSSPEGPQIALLIIHLILAAIDQGNAAKNWKTDRW